MMNAYKHINAALTKKERRQAALLILANVFTSLLDLFCLIFLLFALNFYIGKSASSVSGNLFRKIFSGHNSLMPAIALLFIFCIKNFIGNRIYSRQVKFITQVAVRVSAKNLKDYLYGDYENYSGKDSSVFIRKIIHQPTEFAQYILLNFQLMVSECIMIFFSSAALLIYNYRLFLIILLTLLPPVFILLFITKKRLASVKKNIKPSVEESFQYLGEALSGYVESNIYGKNEYFIARQTSVQSRLSRYILRMQSLQDLPPRYFETFAIGGLFILIVLMKYLSLSSDEYILIVGAFTAAAYKIIPGISRIINLLNQFKSYTHTIFEMDADSISPYKKKTEKSDSITSITFNNVSFSFGSKKIIEAFNRKIYSGSFIGIFGDSGKGKTTLFNLLLGFLQAQTGAIFINDTIQNDKNHTLFFKNIAYVKQQPLILHASILDNIVFEEDKINKQKLNEALMVTGIDLMAKDYPEGVNKILFENGKNISGGQRQRISFARALYKDADVLLLDEPFSELDEGTQSIFLAHLQYLSEQGKIILLIAHNRNCSKYCNDVIDLNDYCREEIIA